MTHNRNVIIKDDVITGDVIIMTHKLFVTKSQKIIKLKIAQSCGGIIFLSGLVLDFDQQKNQSLEFQKFFRVVYTTKTSHYFTEFTLNMKMFMAMPRRAADIIVDGT